MPPNGRPVTNPTAIFAVLTYLSRQRQDESIDM
jgi:hypothetical protein